MLNTYIACTRFNNQTYEENQRYRIKHNLPVIYGSTREICDIYPLGVTIMVAEMNNDTNKIMGIGCIKNRIVYDQRHRIYSNPDYNRIIYKGSYWLSREKCCELLPELIEILENILFKKKSNLKRFQGITILKDRLFMNWLEYDKKRLIMLAKQVFVLVFIKPKEGMKELEKREELEGEELKKK
jgi:hypothetical protein